MRWVRKLISSLLAFSVIVTPTHARIDLEYSDSTLCTNAAVALVQHKGNILEAAKDLTKKESLKALGISMATAGLTEGVMRGMGMETAASSLRQAQEVIRLGQQAGQAAASSAQVAAKAARAAQELEKTAKAVTFMQKFGDRLTRRGIETVVGVGVSAAAGAKPDLGQAAIQLVARAGGDSLAGMAGDGLEAGTLSKFEHGAAHFGTAAVVAAVTNPEDPLRAAMVAGASAVVAHKAAEMMAPEKPTGPVTDEQRAAYNEGVERAANLAKFLTPTLALLSGQGAPGVGASIAASATAVDFNFSRHARIDLQQQAIEEDAELQEALKRSREEAFEREGGAGGSGLTQAEREKIGAQDRLANLRNPEEPMEEFLAPLHTSPIPPTSAQASTNRYGPGYVSPPRRQDAIVPQVAKKIEDSLREDLFEGRKDYFARKGQGASAMGYVGDKLLAIEAQAVKRELEHMASTLQAPRELAREAYHALPSSVQRVLAPLKDGYLATERLLGKGVASLERLGETAGTAVRRRARDDWGIPPSIAQDMGDVAKFGVSYAAAEVVTRGATRGFTAAKAGAKAVGTEGLLAAFEGAGSKGSRFLGHQTGAINPGVVVAKASTSAAVSEATPMLKALSLEQPKISTSNSWMRRGPNGKVAGLEGCEWHHVISDKSRHTKNHELWKVAGVSPQDSVNRMLLPKVEGAQRYATARTIHQGRHFDGVNKSLGTKMTEVMELGRTQGWSQQQYSQALHSIIREERSALRIGERQLNKHHRQPPQNPGDKS